MSFPSSQGYLEDIFRHGSDPSQGTLQCRLFKLRFSCFQTSFHNIYFGKIKLVNIKKLYLCKKFLNYVDLQTSYKQNHGNWEHGLATWSACSARMGI